MTQPLSMLLSMLLVIPLTMTSVMPFNVKKGLAKALKSNVKLTKHCVKVSYARGGGIIPKDICKKRLPLKCTKFLGGLMLKAFMLCVDYIENVIEYIKLGI